MSHQFNGLQEIIVEDGDVIIREGDPGDLFYVLEEGSFPSLSPYIHVYFAIQLRVLCQILGECEISKGGEVLGTITSGSFGDLALMYNSPRAATIKAISDCTLWALDRAFFRQAQVFRIAIVLKYDNRADIDVVETVKIELSRVFYLQKIFSAHFYICISLFPRAGHFNLKAERQSLSVPHKDQVIRELISAESKSARPILRKAGSII
jgi:hypothetical protein